MTAAAMGTGVKMMVVTENRCERGNPFISCISFIDSSLTPYSSLPKTVGDIIDFSTDFVLQKMHSIIFLFLSFSNSLESENQLINSCLFLHFKLYFIILKI